ncbi:ubiquitin-like protein Pup [Streptomyces sp. NPDC017943]|uniref:ubiquitin-like protein Pup n=1 Tax=Streptomyces TaxID=1883 RepID=UPI003451CC1D
MQQQEGRRRRQTPEIAETDEVGSAANHPAPDSAHPSEEADKLLDDIDELLTEVEDAEQWVAEFIQKGGQ